MRIINLFIICIFFFTGCEVEFKSLYPAYPPGDIKLIRLTPANHGGAYNGDYLLLFRSENRKNTRFGGFLIFINTTEASVLQMNTEVTAAYKLGRAAVPTEDPSIYNPTTDPGGIDVQIPVLFTDNPANAGDIITVNSVNYTLKKVLPKTSIISGSWLTMRAYLWESSTSSIIQISEPGNPVQIEL